MTDDAMVNGVSRRTLPRLTSILTRRLLKRGEFASRDDLVDKWCLAGRASARCPPTKPVPP
jgi:hypothetical protein